MIGIARTIDLTLTGRMMDADECYRIGLINRIVPKDEVMSASLALARTPASKPPVAMRLNRQRFREITEEGFRDCLSAGIRIQREAYAIRRAGAHDGRVLGSQGRGEEEAEAPATP